MKMHVQANGTGDNRETTVHMGTENIPGEGGKKNQKTLGKTIADGAIKI